MSGVEPPRSFDLGVLLAVNAVADAYLVYDGPGCNFSRGLAVHGRHDWGSTLLSCSGRHRVQYGGIGQGPSARGRTTGLQEVLQEVVKFPGAGPVLLRGRLSLRERKGLPVMPLGVPSGRACWLEGYAAVLERLAQGLRLCGGAARRENVALVGHFMDRNEGEHRGNVAEFSRIFRALGLRLICVWPSGGTSGDLAEVRGAGTVVSLPYGRRAARTLARRLGAELIETGLPFGIAGTRRWIEGIAAAVGKRRQGEAFIRGEQARLAALLEKAIPSLTGKMIRFGGDPVLAAAFPAFCSETGLSFGGYRRAGCSRHLVPHRESPRGIETEADLFIAGADVSAGPGLWRARMEFGYPSPSFHALRDEPHLGFEGAVSFLQRCLHALARAQPSTMPARSSSSS